jgi:hypothetical protein
VLSKKLFVLLEAITERIRLLFPVGCIGDAL